MEWHDNESAGRFSDARILMVVPEGPPYGGMTAYTSMIRASVLGHSPNVSYFNSSPIHTSRIRRSLESLVKAARISWIVLTRRIRLVYFMTSDFSGFYEKGIWLLLVRLAGACTILHPVGGFIEFYQDAGRGQPVIRFILRASSGIFAVQDGIRDILAEISGNENVWVVPNPVDTSRYPGTFPERSAPDTVSIVYLGDLIEAKGVLDLIDAISMLPPDLPPFRATLVGSGSLEEDCRRKIERNMLEDRIELAGRVSDERRDELLAEADIYCHTSHSEGTPLSMLEAMAAGLPVLGSRVGGIPFVLGEEEFGVLFEARNVDELATKLREMIVSEEKRSDLARRGFDRVRTAFDIHHVADIMYGHFQMTLRQSTHQA